MRCDLHLHTTASDGTWLPEEVVKNALKVGLDLIAVTDHETTNNVIATEILAKEAGLKFVRGVEISANHNHKMFHVLGYGIELENKNLQELLHHNEGLLERKDEESIQILAEQGWSVSLAEYACYVNNRRRGGWKALNYLFDKGLCTDVRDFFTRIFIKENSLSFPVFPPVHEVIALIKAAGGVAVLAHPASEIHGPGLSKTMSEMSKEAFDGFECFHSRHSIDDANWLKEYCLKHNLLITGGSDCHGKFVKDRELGKPVIYLEDLNLGNLI
ncbi:MAG TPA: PHP domain-containing protein [Candidatus Avacidaminococcus intestinavium]|uniref:PHP domain-containing protein n=1 Tax=Candidatus Avacidaminococcus intestinavium TaxID=2840684 RepID=A0A9D1MPQ5_9FIRM|nr:PHP domain-containing protein [Candidatus Avacidaminococcus intestinavium]